MIKPQDIEMELEEAEGYLKTGRQDQARAKFNLALSLLVQLAKSADRVGKIGGPIAGMTVAELLDALQGGIDHPLLDVILGGILGYAAGKKGSALYTDSLSPLWVRAYNGLGDVSHHSGDDSQARKYYATALKALPDDPITMRKIAEVT